MVVQHDPQCRHQGRVVLQGLSHPHHDHIRDNALIRTQPFAERSLGKPELCNDLASGEVAAEALVPGGAKTASHCASRLGRNTKGSAVIFRNENRLNGIAGPDIKEPFDCAISRLMLTQDGQWLNQCASLEFFSQRFGQIRHLVKIRRSALVYPAKQLGCTKALLAQLLTKSCQTIKIKVQEIDDHVLRRKTATNIPWKNTGARLPRKGEKARGLQVTISA